MIFFAILYLALLATLAFGLYRLKVSRVQAIATLSNDDLDEDGEEINWQGIIDDLNDEHGREAIEWKQSQS
jgi:hypothetical protein